MKWAYITWIFLHTYANKIKNDYFINNKVNCIGVIKYICWHLPCPICEKHARQYLKNNPLEVCKKKEDLINYIWNFHNSVNKMLKKPIYSFDELQLYNRAYFLKITKLFLKEFSRNYYFSGKIMSGNKRKIAGNVIRKWLSSIWSNFEL